MQVFESSGYIYYGVRGELYSNSSTRHIIWKLLDTQGSTDTPASNVSESYPDAQDFPFFFEAKYFLRDCNLGSLSKLARNALIMRWKLIIVALRMRCISRPGLLLR